jgi:phosphohistidine phosphatase
MRHDPTVYPATLVDWSRHAPTRRIACQHQKMKTLLLLRHAKSDWSTPGVADHERPLNKRGKRDAPRMGRLLQDENLLPDLILTSTAKRTRQTVKATVEAGSYTGKVKASPALYLAGPEAYIEVLRGVPDKYRRVMVVGHNPGLEEWLEQLTGTKTILPTAALAQVELPITQWREVGEDNKGELRGVWRPRELP